MQRIVGHAVRKEKETECQSGMGVKEEKRGRKRRWYYKSGILLHMGCYPFYPGVKKKKKKKKEKKKERKM
jgi:hypothetical protein